MGGRVTFFGILGIAIFITYWLGVLAGGAGLNFAPVDWNFETSGQFGDSFGPLSAAMSTIAAVSALAAYWSQREELNRLRKQATKDVKRNDTKDFEETFFRLLTMLRDTVKGIDVENGANKLLGPDALNHMINRDFRPHINQNGFVNAYSSMYKRNSNDLGHYLRLFYHIVRFVDSNDEIDIKLYVRILRSTLSMSEMTIIGLNCAFGEGKTKLAPLVGKHALLHNISSQVAKDYGLTQNIAREAFGDRTVLPDGSLSA